MFYLKREVNLGEGRDAVLLVLSEDMTLPLSTAQHFVFDFHQIVASHTRFGDFEETLVAFQRKRAMV